MYLVSIIVFLPFLGQGLFPNHFIFMTFSGSFLIVGIQCMLVLCLSCQVKSGGGGCGGWGMTFND